MDVKSVTIDKLLNIPLYLATSENGDLITAELSKTIQVQQYEPEITKGATHVYVPKNYTILERSVIYELLYISLEFPIITGLYLRKYMSQAEYDERKALLLNSTLSFLLKLMTQKPDSELLKYLETWLA